MHIFVGKVPRVFVSIEHLKLQEVLDSSMVKHVELPKPLDIIELEVFSELVYTQNVQGIIRSSSIRMVVVIVVILYVTLEHLEDLNIENSDIIQVLVGVIKDQNCIMWRRNGFIRS